jgi:hypothetical protein
MAKKRKPCEWVTLEDALRTFVVAAEGTQGSSHIDPMHWHVACRLVVEGGFHPDLIKPRPPFVVKRKAGRLFLHYDASAAHAGEATVLGGLKTKNIDVVVSIPGIGPCVAVSMKGSLNAFRNLTNRLEEAIGDCTNIHMSYPALVYGFLILICANRDGAIPTALRDRLEPEPETGRVKAADVAIRSTGEVSEFIGAFHEAMVRLAGRRDLRDDVSRYEAISLLLASPDDATLGQVVREYPATESPLHIDKFFDSLYTSYDLRYVYSAKLLRSRTRRLVWDRDSPAVWDPRAAGMTPRIGDDTAEPVPSFEVDGPAEAEDSGADSGSDDGDKPPD